MSRGTKPDKVRALAQKRANQRMRKEILPLLTRTHPRPLSWNPLRIDDSGTSTYGLKMITTDALVLEIMSNDKLMERVEEIIYDEIYNAAVSEPKAFVTTVFKHLMSE